MDSITDTVTTFTDRLADVAVTAYSAVAPMADFIGLAGFCGIALGCAIGAIVLSATVGSELFGGTRPDRRR